MPRNTSPYNDNFPLFGETTNMHIYPPSYKQVLKEKQNKFFDAVQAGKIDLVEKFINEDANIINARDEDGNTPLLWAYKNDKKKALSILLKAGADVNAKNKYGRNIFLDHIRDDAAVTGICAFGGLSPLFPTISFVYLFNSKILVTYSASVVGACFAIGLFVSLIVQIAGIVCFRSIRAEAEGYKSADGKGNPPPYELICGAVQVINEKPAIDQPAPSVS
ncbi:ankyrin repeat domain-containing protein [Wolbachia endosymbiont of Ctenocephalides felis wCfeT]|uniref:ankyrin repeat domain-containing protein n=1 Tax=Wolbachia endosymbiont of Ctenocephalides felis wCfeT TaxID=2732593 RepID=UPI00144845DB|nr:ankyrin repeat domain-containing protein [Wolbachia endosymbiont of Ctenocephalides felis wCfeT]